MKIKGKLLLMVVPLLALAIFITVYFSYLVNNTSKKCESLYYDELYTISSTLINADRDFYQAYSALLKNIAFTEDGEVNSAYIADYDENIEQTKDRVSQVDKIADSSKYLSEYKYNGRTLCEEYEIFEANIEKLETLYDVDTNTGDLAAYEECFEDTRDNISNMEDLIEEYAEESEADLQSSIKTSIIIAIVITVIVMILVVILAAYYIKTIRRSLESLTEEINIMSTKDLTQSIKVYDGNDEIAQLSRAAASLREQLLGMMMAFSNSSTSLQQASKTMSENTKESVQSIQAIDTAAAELANTATQQATDATMMAAEIQNLNGITEESLNNTTSLAHACKDIEDVTHSGMKIVDELTTIATESQRAFNNIFDAISGIDEKARTISSASDMISDIASQTNLLSLNASIEAARAGEAGRGFAVVADEIRQLAEQSASSVETINAMIVALSQSSEEAGRQSEMVKKYVEDQMKSVTETQKGFEAIVNNVNIVNNGVTKLRGINDNLGDRVHQITGLVESLAAASEENAATSEELSATTTSVAENIMSLEETEEGVTKLSDELNDIVSEYKI